MNSVDQIADLILREALWRQEVEGGNIGNKIHAIQMEIMLILVDLMLGVREGECNQKEEKQS